MTQISKKDYFELELPRIRYQQAERRVNNNGCLRCSYYGRDKYKWCAECRAEFEKLLKEKV